MELDDVLRNVSERDKAVTSVVDSFVTQQDHPVLARPFFCVHPCKTAELMTVVMQAAANAKSSASLCVAEHKGSSLAGGADVTDVYLISWLSLLGPAVGLTVPIMDAIVAGAEGSKPGPKSSGVATKDDAGEAEKVRTGS